MLDLIVVLHLLLDIFYREVLRHHPHEVILKERAYFIDGDGVIPLKIQMVDDNGYSTFKLSDVRTRILCDISLDLLRDI